MGRSVLVIDDEADVRDGIKRVLERAGFSVRVIGNATDALLELQRVPAGRIAQILVFRDGGQVFVTVKKE